MKTVSEGKKIVSLHCLICTWTYMYYIFKMSFKECFVELKFLKKKVPRLLWKIYTVKIQ